VRGLALPPTQPPPGDFLLQTALPNAWGIQQSYPTDASLFHGTPFSITRTVHVRHASAWMVRGSGNVFAAVVRLSGPGANPPPVGSAAFANSVVGSTLINAGNAADEYGGDFNDLQLTPGSYALLFGSGLFGATGSTEMFSVQDQLVTAGSLLWIGQGSFWTQFGTPSLHMTLSGIAPEISVAPDPVAFGNVPVGTQATRSVTVTNLRAGDLHLSGIALAGSDVAQFSLGTDATACAIATLPAQGTCVFTLRYTPATSGAHAARIDVTSDGVPNPYSLTIGGNGVPVHIVTPSAGPHGSIAPNTPQSVADGASVSFALTPDTGYHTSGVSGSCGGTLAGGTFTIAVVNTDCSVAASFAIDAPTTLAANGGTPQSATVNSSFAQPLRVFVSNASGIGVPGIVVNFTAPASGASASVSASAVSDDNGLASVSASANAIAGSYAVQATVAGVSGVAAFQLTNLAGRAAHVQASGGSAQSATVGSPFAQPLAVSVTDASGNAVANVSVTFAAPAAGASASLAMTSVVTSANGIATTTATANALVGAYGVIASVNGVIETATFALENRAPDVALSVAIDDGKDYVRYGQMLDYRITVSNAGSAVAANVDIAATLPAQLDAAAATWICLDANGGACSASGSGALTDHATVPAHGSVRYVLSVPVRVAASGAGVSVTATSTGPYAGDNASAQDTSILVLFRDDFENAAVAPPSQANSIASGDIVHLQWSTLAPTNLIDAVLDARAADGSGFRVECLTITPLRLRLHAFAADGREWTTPWGMVYDETRTTLAFVEGDLPVLLLGGTEPALELSLGTSARDWQVRVSEGVRITH